MKITKKQVRLLKDQAAKGKYIAIGLNLELWFPQAFEDKKPKLEVGKWYKHKSVGGIMCICKTGGDWVKCYGVTDKGEWYDNRGNDYYYGSMTDVDHWELASHTEVEKALIIVAKKRGFANGAHIKNSPLGFCYNQIHDTGSEISLNGEYLDIGIKKIAIFHKGQWAEVVETITKDEAEKQLGKKIV